VTPASNTGLRFHEVQVLRQWPHPGRGFTQGLIADGDTLWESTGRYRKSSLRRYRIGAPEPAAAARLPAGLFGEGICWAGDHIWQLTWRERVALRWDPGTLELLETRPYDREGWGICTTGEHVLTSDGSSELVRRDPRTLRPINVIQVRVAGHRVLGINDLAWARGRVWANLFGHPYLAGIDPESGEVTDVVDARPARERHWGNLEAVMNGIAPLPMKPDAGELGGGEPDSAEFLLTGKYWNRMYHVRLVPPSRPQRERPAHIHRPPGWMLPFRLPGLFRSGRDSGSTPREPASAR
jgi:glutaminyl-peptide cyclotransferase